MVKIAVEELDRTLTVPAGANLRESLLDSGVEVYPFAFALLNCRGRGICGTCRVKVTQGEENLSPRTTAELNKLRKRPDLRLACQCVVRGDVRILTLP
jgi:ferredoxin